ncbi:unnamed protein product [Dibothriocephalus latus]|uniref:Uncharacterized protein n=1 Tax=Dibothriocephalus latus TaxID=60516 RepID=A0A3P7LPN4_DIBLA|nr:unnamed protein product [Dibothriocephalus latus]
MEDCVVLEGLGNLPLTPYLRAECGEVIKELAAAVYVKLSKDQVWSECLPGGEMLHCPDNFLRNSLWRLWFCIQMEINADLDLPLPPREAIRAVEQLWSGNPPGSDTTTPKIYKYAGHQLMTHLIMRFPEIWRPERVSRA